MKSVPHVMCKGCGKRGFLVERSADKALGRARAKRKRRGITRGVKGLTLESRYYECPYGYYHLTSMSHKEYLAA